MTISFMALFVMHLEERIGGVKLLLPLSILAGILSCYYWRRTDDLRPYGFIQFYPIVMLPILLAYYPPSYTASENVVYTLGLYGAAKLTESLDRPIYRATGKMISGHTL
jgi:hypothetical protein